MNAIVTILNLLPALITAIKAIEDAIPGSGQGEAKLAAVRAILEAVDSSVSKLWPQISAVVGVLVGLFNKSGVFKS